MVKDGKIKIDKFTGHEFGFWKMQIEDYLYQKKLHEPLAEVKRTGMKAEDWTLLDRQALGVVRLSLAKNVAYNVVNEKTTYGLFKALSNMYEKPSVSNKVFLIRQLISDDIKFDDEVQALLLLSSLPDSCQDTCYNSREDIRWKTSEEYSNSLLSAKDKGKGRNQDRWQKHNRVR
ncbi:hypothetical protein Tco_0751794 [Tanacetum coccineum]|uniref:Retrovirus-related Pol polyprotein from transposon TNT 1-94 n=1 Tax=Tanacetum coccineum TaxID=301880 RepID=A0ABQ4Z8P1_9ASTR